MAVALEQFVKQIADSGVIAPGKLEDFVPPKAYPKDAEELARQLVQSKQLTKYQAQEIYQGRAKSLILGNYTILDKIGAGGMGQVFKAEHRRMHRTVAIKMLPPAVTKDQVAVARFQREVEAAAKLRHTNIVAADDADEANGVHFLVMEFAEGSDLSALVKKNGPFPVAKAVNYILQAALGLEYAHKHGVIHRDIKPANLLLNSEGTVKVLDMGLARIESGEDAGTQAELTGTGAVMGTVDYMAPEQALSTKHADARADIYSLGCSLHYLITGKAAYDGDTLMAKLLAHRDKPIPSLGPSVREQVQAVFEKMIAKNIEARYQTMSDVTAALQECAAATSTSGTRQPISEPSPSNGNLSFLAEATAHTQQRGQTKQAKPIKVGAKWGKKFSGWNRKKRLLIGGAVGGGLLAAAILAAVVFKLRTKDGTLIVEVNQPDAVVQVLGADGTMEITQPGGKGAITIAVDPGKHRLKVEKDGFQFFAQDFEMDSGGTATIKATLVEDKPWFKPAFVEWQKEVAALPAEKQIVAVVKKLQELNPDFGGHESHGIEKGVVTRLDISTDKHLTNISPVRALRGLKSLDCWGTPIIDLSPLTGMSLTRLNCDQTRIRDLSPLTGMPLTIFHYGHTDVADLSPLKGMPLTDLGSRDTKVADLSPLKGMHLLRLELDGTRISNLSPLKGMPLTTLYFNNTNVSDLSPLEGMILEGLWLTPKNITKGMELVRQMKTLGSIGLGWDGPFFPPAEFWKKYDAGEFGKPDTTTAAPVHKPITTFNDPAFQQWMKTVAALPAAEQVDAVARKLQDLNPGFDGTVVPKIEGDAVKELQFVTDDVTDISPVRALASLTSLSCGDSGGYRGKLSDLSPLAGMKLEKLACGGTKIADLSPLQGMPLTELQCNGTKIASLLPLQGMRLTFLKFGTTHVSDLSPLRGMPLEYLSFYSTQVSDLSPLKGMPLTHLECNGTAVSDLSPLAGMHLTDIVFTPKSINRGIESLRQMQSLKTIHTQKEKFSRNVFWKKYDAGEFGK